MVDRSRVFCALLFFVIFFIMGLTAFISGQLFYKSHKSVRSQCQVMWVGLQKIKLQYNGIWKVMVINKNIRKQGSVKELVQGNSYEEAWTNAQKYKINQTYTCYGPSLHEKTLFDWDWHWEKPANWTGYFFIVIGTLSTILMTVVMLRLIRSEKVSTSQWENQYEPELQRSLRNEDHQQATVPM